MIEQTTQATSKRLPAWASVEIMGHNRHVGLVSEITLGGSTLLAIDEPDPNYGPGMRRIIIGSASIYRMTFQPRRILPSLLDRIRSPAPLLEHKAAEFYDPDDDDDELTDDEFDEEMTW